MNAQEKLQAMDMAGARAVGMLRALLSLGTLPEAHREAAKDIVAEFNGEATEEEA